MKISEFVKYHPELELDFETPIRDQPRIYDAMALDQYPVELEPDSPYHPGGRGRPNLNQTRGHSQCATCYRVLRNDYFYTLPSMMKRNVVFSHCRECSQGQNAVRYELRADLVRQRREAIWRYLAPQCALCGFDKHVSAMDLHHLADKDAQLLDIINQVALTADYSRIEILFREAAISIPLCSNCHRMLHAGAANLPQGTPGTTFKMADLLSKLNAIQ